MKKERIDQIKQNRNYFDKYNRSSSDNDCCECIEEIENLQKILNVGADNICAKCEREEKKHQKDLELRSAIFQLISMAKMTASRRFSAESKNGKTLITNDYLEDLAKDADVLEKLVRS